MSKDPGPPDYRSPKRGGLLGDLQALILSLQSLGAQLASRLLSSRMRATTRTSAPRESVPIGTLLAERITLDATDPAAASPATGDQPPDPAASDPTQTESHPPPPTPRHRLGFTLFNPFSEHLNRQHGTTEQHPHIRDQLREHTFSHLNKALSLARQGNTEGAKLYAGLAENAMRQAGEYMTDDEYDGFRAEVEERLRTASR